MARERGELPLSAIFESQSAKPSDPRQLTSEKNDLVLDDTWTALDGNIYTYAGMIVSVPKDNDSSNNGVYWLKNSDYSNIDNWVKLNPITSHEDLDNLLGGLPNEHYHLSYDQYVNVTAITISLDGKQDKLIGYGYVKASGTTIYYDDNDYQLSSTAINIYNIGNQTVFSAISSNYSLNAEYVPFNGITNKPSTIDGYGITDAITVNNINNQSVFSALTSNYSNIAGNIDFSGITNTPTTIEGYGITNAITTENIINQTVFSALTANFSETAGNISFTGITDTPTTISGYGITDAITTENISNQNVYSALTSNYSEYSNLSESTKKLFSAITINTVPFDGSNNITIYDSTKQPLLNGYGFIKSSGETIYYDNTTYQPIDSAINIYNISGQSVNHSLISEESHKLLSGNTINNVLFDGSSPITIYDDTKLPLSGGQINGDLIISGALNVAGGAIVVSAKTVTTNDNIILLNNGEIASGITNNYSGVEIDRGLAINYRFVFDESTDTFRVGEINKTQAVATREDNPLNNHIAVWSSSNNMYESGIDSNSIITTTNISNQNVYSALTSNYSIISSKLATAHTINGVSFDGTSDIIVYDNTKQVQLNGLGFIKASGTTISYDNTIYQPLATAINTSNIGLQIVTSALTAGNAIKLNSPVTINGISFDGTSNITVYDTTKIPLSGTTDLLKEGTNNLYFTGNRVLNTKLTGFTSGSSFSNVIYSDSILSAFSKLDYNTTYLNNNKATDNSVVHLANAETITGGKAFAKGAIFYGENNPFPTGVGRYVAQYVSATYGCRILGYDGATYYDLKLGRLITGTTFQLTLGADGSSVFAGTSLTAPKYIIPSGTSLQFLKADGTLDSSSYQTNTLTQNKLWIGSASNTTTEIDSVVEWVAGASQPGQKEVKGLITEMVISDGSIIAVPVIFHKTLTITTSGVVQLLSDNYTGRYYVIESITLIARSVSLTGQPTFSIGTNSSSYNDIAASQTLTLLNGTNTVTLTTNASKALVSSANGIYINITNAAIGSGIFELIMKGYLSSI